MGPRQVCGIKQKETEEKHFFVISIPGGPMEVFASTDLDDVTDWVGALRATCLGAPDRSMLAGLKQD